MSLVTLVSGGVDSTLMSLLAREEGASIHPLFIDYGQLAARREWIACRRQHRIHRLPPPKKVDLSGFGRTIPSGITSRQMRLREDAFLPGRNMLFLLVGASYAYEVGAHGVAIGLLDPKTHLFPDQTIGFLKQAEQVIAAALGRKIAVVAPLIRFSKKDVLNMARRKHLSGTYSCHAGGSSPCGQCVSCLEVINAKKNRR